MADQQSSEGLPRCSFPAVICRRHAYAPRLLTGKEHFGLIRAGIRTTGQIVDYKQQSLGNTVSSDFTLAFMPIVEFKVTDRDIRFEDWRGSSAASKLNDAVLV
jgi:hypothetical protein